MKKGWKLVTGIINCCLFMFICFQSCAAGFVNSWEDNGSSSGTIGLIVAVCMLLIGIVSLLSRNEKGKNWIIIVCGIISFVCGIIAVDTYPDIIIWGFWGLINAVVSII